MTRRSQRSALILLGDVLSVSPDRLIDEATGESYYDARITIPPEEVDRLDSVNLMPGMTAQAMILTGNRTALSYFVEPLSDGLNGAFREDS